MQEVSVANTRAPSIPPAPRFLVLHTPPTCRFCSVRQGSAGTGRDADTVDGHDELTARDQAADTGSAEA